jgi:ABC-type branched-subunit amino acid transport system ATPase component
MAAVALLREHTSIIIVEHKVEQIAGFADRVYVMVNGRIEHEGDAAGLRRNEELQQRLLGVGA